MHTPASAAAITVPDPPHVEIIGNWSSRTVTLYVHVVVFPELSVTVHKTLVTPKLKITPSKELAVPDVTPDN